MLSSHIDGMISHLLSRNSGKSLNSRIPERQILTMCQEAIDVLASQPPLLELSEPIRICGDIHGQYSDLLRLFRQNGFPPDTTYLFLGDYVDRGKHSLETIYQYPEHFFLLRGNHECKLINTFMGSTRNAIGGTEAFECGKLSRCFRHASFFSSCRRANSVHAWWSQSSLNSMKQLRQIRRPVDPKNPSMLIDCFGLIRILGLLVGVLTLGACLTSRVVQDGYEFFASRKLVTIFSAPHYCGQFDNAAATMYVDENLSVSFSVLRPALNRKTSTEGSSSIRSARLHKRRHRL
uniref:Serine/threonine-protein phosphatase n=1 Tax=Ditylenchus dipsaci TaxID=166011 RepID=A0A915CU96_9BILA